MSYHELSAPDLVKQWRRIVNDNVQMGRDAHLIKEFLQGCSSAQILLGIYEFQGNKTISIPQFLKQSKDWLELDEEIIDIELAVCIANHVPNEYYTYYDLKDEENARDYQTWQKARTVLKDWAQAVLE